MIEKISIQNFKNFTDFQLQNIGRINLFTGKNNTGKSSLLEAIALCVSNLDPKLLIDILKIRGEIYKEHIINLTMFDENRSERIFSSLFTSRVVDYREHEHNIKIACTQYSADQPDNDLITQEIALRFVAYSEHEYKNGHGISIKKRQVFPINDESDIGWPDSEKGIEISRFGQKVILSLDQGGIVEDRLLKAMNSYSSPVKFIYTDRSQLIENSSLWDKIALTEKEKYVIEALNIIPPF